MDVYIGPLNVYNKILNVYKFRPYVYTDTLKETKREEFVDFINFSVSDFHTIGYHLHDTYQCVICFGVVGWWEYIDDIRDVHPITSSSQLRESYSRILRDWMINPL